ncbi:type II toxin-antitoxin system HicB family antitoxin [Limosilactobacillus allomucosae]|uniref:Type II toxin-antitoxin system HicB family antitoxin n=1 Tax=Limosilactobacillus allomucosae TaxID=3142938 RepID=A0AAU7C1W2_9LACO
MELVSYGAVFTPTEKEIQVDFPDVPEAFTQGQTMDEAIENAKLGLAIVINDKLGHFEPAPAATPIDQLKTAFSDREVRLIEVDLEKY